MVQWITPTPQTLEVRIIVFLWALCPMMCKVSHFCLKGCQCEIFDSTTWNQQISQSIWFAECVISRIMAICIIHKELNLEGKMRIYLRSSQWFLKHGLRTDAFNCTTGAVMFGQIFFLDKKLCKRLLFFSFYNRCFKAQNVKTALYENDINGIWRMPVILKRTEMYPFKKMK